MASGASVNATLEDAINDPFFGEREAITLSYGENGSPTNEQTTPHYSMADAQPIALAAAGRARHRPRGRRTPTRSSTSPPPTSSATSGSTPADNPSTDFYSFTAQAGTLINFQLMSAVLTRSVALPAPPRLTTTRGLSTPTLTIYDSSGQVIAYNDDSFQDTDSTIIDLTLPDHGHLLRDGDLFPQVGLTGRAADRRLRALHVHLRRRDCATRPAGDTMYAGSGNDTIIAGSADDTIAAHAPGHDHLRLGHRDHARGMPPTLNVSAGPNQTVNEGTASP